MTKDKSTQSRAFEERYKKLNKEQKEAVDYIDGPLLVIAGPGSGKTELLSIRTANIIRQGLVTPSNILCLTFTENGAINMRERLSSLIKEDAYRVNIFTFHAFCNHIIGRYPEYFYNATNFSQANDVTRAEIITEIFKSLPHKHPLSARHPELGFAYLRDVTDRIKHIKSGGYTPDEYKAIVTSIKEDYAGINEALTLWPEDRLNVKKLDVFNQIITSIDKLNSTTGKFMSLALRNAIEESVAIGKTEPVANFKKKYLVVDAGSPILKESHNYDKILAVAEFYELYENKMYELGLYDYDDMIIEVAHVLRANNILRNELEEQYQYIMIDEFQDTNMAQMGLVKAITSNEVHEGRPNVCVVGDDDQAIYKFQGAEVSHIMEFRESVYRDVKTVVLDKNYRSTKDVISIARQIITKGNIRLENRFEDINKELKSENKSLPKGDIEINKYSSEIEQYTDVAMKIKKALDEGIDPAEIAILSRNHKDLKATLPYLDKLSIPYEYIKKANVFDEEHIKQIITVCEYVSSVLNYENNKDYLLPEILSYKFFGLNNKEVFEIAIKAKSKNISWIDALKDSSDEKLHGIYELLTDLSIEAKSSPLENLIEKFIEKSNFKEFYFGKDKLRDTPATYVYFLASLKTFIDALREWKKGEIITANDVVQFVKIHKDNNIPLISESMFTRNKFSIQLMTAHASKGLEFEEVFIINAHDKSWTKGNMVNKATVPSVLSQLINPAGDDEDDFIRLFFVAITRAKHTLHVSGHEEMFRYLPHELIKEVSTEELEIKEEDHESVLGLGVKNIKEDEWAMLAKLVENYKMPVTHLNNFLDIKNGGPIFFVEQNLLHFPQPMNASGAYGSAVHKAIEEMVIYPKYNAGDRPTLTHVLSKFDFVLSRSRLNAADYKFMKDRGEKTLKKYYDEKIKSFKDEDKIEVDMKSEGVVIDGAHLTGKIDFLRKKDNMFEVLDFKTGKSFDSWEGKDDDTKIKLHKYRQQLITYKLLLENSSTYKLPVKSLALQFVEENDEGQIIELELDINDGEVERTKKLISVVFKKIINLDFPDTDNYEKSYKGIIAFEDDLINEVI